MALIVNKGQKRLEDKMDTGYASAHSGARQFIKAKALRCIGPEHANSLGLPAESPVFVSPYISVHSVCYMCRASYGPLVYQVGRTTEAQHFCTRNGGIYVRLIEDTSNKWVYENDLWDAICVPSGPLRMGNDKGFQFRSVKLIRMVAPKCFMCQGSMQIDLDPTAPGSRKQPLSGRLMTNGHQSDTATLVPVCDVCVPNFHANNFNELTEWKWTYDGTEVRFSPLLTGNSTNAPSYEEFMRRTSRKERPQ